MASDKEAGTVESDELRQALLQTDGRNGHGGQEDSLEAEKDEPDLDLSAAGSWKAAALEEAKKQVIFAGPMVGMNVLQYMLNLVAVIYVGHIGKLELAASSLATTMVNLTGHIMLLALASGLETFCGQAYGAKQYHLIGQFTQSAMLLLGLFSCSVALFWWHLEPALLLLGQDPNISHLAGLYARWLLPSLFASSFIQPLIKFYQAQSQTGPLAWCQLVALLIHIPLTYVLVWPLKLGFLGAAMSSSVAWCVNLALLSGYLRFSKLPTFDATWTGWTWSALQFDFLWAFLKLAIPSAVMICLEYWCFEVNVLFSGMLPNPELQVSAFTIGFNTVTLSWMVPYGISAAVSTRVSNELGAGHPNSARFSARVSYSLVIFISGTIYCLLLIFRRQWASIFIGEDEVVDLVSSMMPFIGWICLVDGFTGINAGAIRGIGHQHLGAAVNLAAYYCIGVPGAYFLAFKFGCGAFGLWWGLMGGQGTQAAVLAFIVLCFTNWEKEASRAEERLVESEAPSFVTLPSHSGSYRLLPSPHNSSHTLLPIPSPGR